MSVSVFSADSGELGSLKWSYSDGTLTLSGYGEMTDFASYAEQPWRGLAVSVKRLVISEGITSVGGCAFASMPSLSSVSLPKGLKRIGDGAFEKCYALTFADVPSSVTYIGDRAFADCWRLTEADVARAASYLTHIGDHAFAGCFSLKKITLPLRLEYIGEGAFSGCRALDGAVLPDKLSYLGRFAFQDCASLTEINVPWQIIDLPDYVFFGCTSLRRVSFGRYLESIGKESFLWCASLKEIRLPSGVTEIPDYSIGYYYFDREFVPYGGLTVIAASPAGMEYAVKNSMRLVTDDPSYVCDSRCPYCFLCTADCEYYSCYEKCPTHTFPITGSLSDTVTWSLSEDFELTVSGEGEMPDFTYDTVPWSAYRNAILKVSVADGITSVGSYAFDSHSALGEVSLAESVTRIGRKAFALCTSLGGVEAKGAAELGDYAFCGCTSLEYARFGDALTSVGDFAFESCVRLLELRTGESLAVIGESAFESCPMLERVYLPESVSSVGGFALGYTYGGDRHYYKNDNFTIVSPLFGEGQRYAEKNGINYERSDVHICDNACEVCKKCLDSTCPYPECARRCDGICTAPWDAPFTDVRESDWFSDSVRYVYLKRLFTGMTEDTFEPSGSVTRAQLTVVLWRLAGAPEGSADAPFTDLRAAWYRDAVSWAYEAGVVTGKSETEFAPMDKITREQMMTMLMRFCEKVLKLDTEARADTDVFADAAEISAYAAEPISWALAEGLLTGKESDDVKTVAPRSPSSRAECATVFARFLKK